MYNTDQKNDKRVPSSITPSASSSLSGVSPSSCNLSGEQTETSQSSCRETTGYQLCSNDLPFGRFSEGLCQRRRLSGENTQLATLRNTATETQSQAWASGRQLSQWCFRDRRLPCALCQQGTKLASATHKKSQCLMQTCVLLLSGPFTVFPGCGKQIASAHFLPTAMSSNPPAHGFGPW